MAPASPPANPVSFGAPGLPTPGRWLGGAGGDTQHVGQVALDAHLPLLAPDVMLLHSVAKIGFLGASYDFGPLGVNVEGVTEP